MTHVTPVIDKLFQPRSLLHKLITADSWESGTWLHWKDWLALWLAAAGENNLLPPHLVLQEEMMPILALQDFFDETALPPQFDFQNSFDFFAVNWVLDSCSDTPWRGSLRSAYSGAMQLRPGRSEAAAIWPGGEARTSGESLSARRALPTQQAHGGFGQASTEGAEACDSGERPQARPSLPAHQTENSPGIGLARPSIGLGGLNLTGVQRGWE